MFATLTLRRTVPISLPTWGAVGALTLGGSVAGLTVFSATRAPHAHTPPRAAVEQIAFDRFVASTSAISIDTSLGAPMDAIASGGRVAVVHAHGSAVAFIDGRSGRPRAEFGTPSDSARWSLAVAAADSSRWLILDPKRAAVDLVTANAARVSSIALPRGMWSSVAWDGGRRHVIVTGLELDGPRTARDGRSIHEFDLQGVEVGAHREIAPVKHRLQASFNIPFVAIDGSAILSGSNLSNEILLFDRASSTERVVRIADDWFQPIDWALPHQSVPPKSIAEPTMKWLSSQTMLTAIIPLANRRFVARFTQHSADRDRYVYALVDSAGRTRALTQPTTVKLSSSSGDTVSGIDFGTRARVFVGVVSAF